MLEAPILKILEDATLELPTPELPIFELTALTLEGRKPSAASSAA
jgi:hypothetical protein